MEKTSPVIVNIIIPLVVLAAALDSGLAVSILFIFFTLQYPKSGTVRRYRYVADNILRVFRYSDYKERHSYLVGVRVSSMALSLDGMN